MSYYPCVAVTRLEISEHPQAPWCPCKATIRPPIRKFGAPSIITFTPWPGIGQTNLSPTRAIPIPAIMCVMDAVMTRPPCEVISPSRTIGSAMCPPLYLVFPIASMEKRVGISRGTLLFIFYGRQVAVPWPSVSVEPFDSGFFFVRIFAMQTQIDT